MIIVPFVLVRPLCPKVPPPFIFQSKSVTSQRAPTAPCTDGGKPKVLPSFTNMPCHFFHILNHLYKNKISEAFSDHAACASLFRYRIRRGAEHRDHAHGQQWHVLANQRGRWGKQNMCRRQKRRRRMWRKDRRYNVYVSSIYTQITNNVTASSLYQKPLRVKWQKIILEFDSTLFFAERQRRSIGLPGTWAQSHRRREHPKDKMRLVAARALRQCCLLLRVDIQGVQTLPQLGEELMVRCEKSTPHMTLPQAARGGGGFGPTNSKTSPARTTGEKWGKSHRGKWPFWDFVADLSFYGEDLEISDWRLDKPNGISSILPLCKRRHPGC